MGDTLRIYPTPNALYQSATEQFINIAESAITTRGHFSLALAGGSTPKGLYNMLSETHNAKHVDWSLVRVYWGDERCVPPEHPDSNYRMSRESLLDHVRIPVGNIHRMRGELEPEVAAKEYDQLLRKMFRRQTGMLHEPQPRFDLVLLGMGDDGHTASLFPHTEALEEERYWVVANWVDKHDSWRITLTAPAINAAAHVMFLVTGANKAEALAQVLEGDPNPHDYPAQMIKPAVGSLTWLVDDDAASKLVQRGTY